MKLQHLLVGSAVLVAACSSDKTTGPTIGASGSLAFAYTGAGTSASASFTATGAIPTNLTSSNSLGATAWAAGTSQSGSLEIAAAVPRSSTTWDLSTISINQTTVGSETIDPTCTTATCADVSLLIATDANDTSFSFVCQLTSGTISIASISANRASGSFSGTGTCFTQSGGSSAFTVTNGTFDVPLTSVVP
jgi:hypothetical protein